MLNLLDNWLSEYLNSIVTMVERVSKKVVCKKLEFRQAELTKQAIIEGRMPFKSTILTLTSDNGSEFAYHDKIGMALNADSYFAHPYAS